MIACTITMGSKHTLFPKLKNQTTPKVYPWKRQLASSVLREQNFIRGGTQFCNNVHCGRGLAVLPYLAPLLHWAEAKGLRPSDHLFPGGSAWLEHKFLEVLGSTPWRHCRWHSLRKGGSAACYARHPRIQFFLWWGSWRSVGTALRYATAFQHAAVMGPLGLPTEPGSGGGGAAGVLTHLEVWAPNMFPSEAEPLPTAAFHPPAWPEDLLDPPPPPAASKAAGGEGLSGRPRTAGSSLAAPTPGVPPPPTPPPPPGSTGVDETFVTVDSSDSSGSEDGGGGSAGSALRSRGPPSPLAPASEPLRPALSSRDAGVREDTWGSGRMRARCSKRGGGPLE